MRLQNPGIVRCITVDVESIKESILFYKLNEIHCPHGRPWKVCVRARWLLSRLNQATAPSKEWLLQMLKDGDIDPVIPANSLCSFEPIIAIRQEGSTTPVPFPAVVVAPGKDSPSTLPAARAGRLLNTFENFLVDTVIG
jgi:hypothetical protein